MFNTLGLQAQDSIPNTPVTPPADIAQPATEQPTDQDTKPVSNTQNNNTAIDDSNQTPVVIKPEPKLTITKPSPEYLLAVANNPFALIRDGKPKKKQPKSLSISSKFKSSNTVKNEKQELEVEEQESEEQVEDVVFVSVDTSTASLNKSNPFRLEGTEEDRKAGVLTKKIKFNPEAGSGTKTTTTSTFAPIFDMSKVDVNPLGTLKFTLSIILLGFLSVIMTLFRSEVKSVYQAFLSSNLLSLLHREKGTILRLPYILMYLLTILSIGTMVFLTTNFWGLKLSDNNLKAISLFVSGIGAIFLFRHLTLGVLSIIFPFKKEARIYNFMIAIFNFIIGIVLLPFIIFIAFANSNSHIYLIYTALSVVALIYLYRIIRSLLIGNKYLIHNKFHFFMYLCTIEIAPLLIFLKLIGL